jgi:hypothetical protein
VPCLDSIDDGGSDIDGNDDTDATAVTTAAATPILTDASIGSSSRVFVTWLGPGRLTALES